METAELFHAVRGLSLPEAAARFAAAGVPVFPCVPGGKRPLVEHGFHDASTDADQVGFWWRRWPSANVGVPTGMPSGLEVVDVDRKGDSSGFAAFARARRVGLVAGWLALVRTPSGGIHAYFPAQPGRPQPSWQAASVRVDFRGDGGYVIVPPSVGRAADGSQAAGYALIGGARPVASPVDAQVLRHLLDPRPALPVLRSRDAGDLRDVERLARWVAARGEGERNRGLFWAACRLAEAGVNAEVAQAALGAAAERAGLTPREALVTIRSAFRSAGGTSSRDGPVTEPAAQRRAAGLEGRALS